ncbi:MAG: hypothetical protein ACOY0T_31800 [Myxococcota bacterium]
MGLPDIWCEQPLYEYDKSPICASRTNDVTSIGTQASEVMYLPRGSILAFTLVGLACSGSPGGDLFSNGGSGSGNSQGGSAAGGASAQGGSVTTQNGGVTQTQGGSVASGGTSVSLGGASSNGGDGAGGAVAISGGAPSAGGNGSGGTTSGAGGQVNGGAGTAGSATGGAPSAAGSSAAGGSSMTSGGSTSGGSASGGSGGNVNCTALRTRLNELLDTAQECERNVGGPAGPAQCTGRVMTECGCTVPVNSGTSMATQAYNTALNQFKKQCPNIACAAVLCVNPQGATCSSSGQGTPHCIATGFDNSGP